MSDYNDKKIHGWNGDECPVHPKTVVKFWKYDGGTDENYAGCLRWVHNSLDTDIIAFQVVAQHVEPKVIWVNETKNITFDAYTSKEAACRSASSHNTRIAVKYVEAKNE